jgi:hypothetical protein
MDGDPGWLNLALYLAKDVLKWAPKRKLANGPDPLKHPSVEAASALMVC